MKVCSQCGVKLTKYAPESPVWQDKYESEICGEGPEELHQPKDATPREATFAAEDERRCMVKLCRAMTLCRWNGPVKPERCDADATGRRQPKMAVEA